MKGLLLQNREARIPAAYIFLATGLMGLALLQPSALAQPNPQSIDQLLQPRLSPGAAAKGTKILDRDTLFSLAERHFRAHPSYGTWNAISNATFVDLNMGANDWGTFLVSNYPGSATCYSGESDIPGRQRAARASYLLSELTHTAVVTAVDAQLLGTRTPRLARDAPSLFAEYIRLCPENEAAVKQMLQDFIDTASGWTTGVKAEIAPPSTVGATTQRQGTVAAAPRDQLPSAIPEDAVEASDAAKSAVGNPSIAEPAAIEAKSTAAKEQVEVSELPNPASTSTAAPVAPAVEARTEVPASSRAATPVDVLAPIQSDHQDTLHWFLPSVIAWLATAVIGVVLGFMHKAILYRNFADFAIVVAIPCLLGLSLLGLSDQVGVLHSWADIPWLTVSGAIGALGCFVWSLARTIHDNPNGFFMIPTFVAKMTIGIVAGIFIIWFIGSFLNPNRRRQQQGS